MYDIFSEHSEITNLYFCWFVQSATVLKRAQFLVENVVSKNYNEYSESDLKISFLLKRRNIFLSNNIFFNAINMSIGEIFIFAKGISFFCS